MFNALTLTLLMFIASFFHSNQALASLFDQIGITKDVCGHNGLCGNASATIGDVVSEMKKAGDASKAEPGVHRKLTPLADVPEREKIPYRAYKELPVHFRIERVKDRFGRAGTLVDVWENKGSSFEKYAWRSKTQVIVIEVKDGLIADRSYSDSSQTAEDESDH